MECNKRESFKKSQWLRKKARDCTLIIQIPATEKPIEEDRRLLNWNRWIKSHEKIQKHLTKSLRREPLDLALNSHEKIRSRRETEYLIETANAHYRGELHNLTTRNLSYSDIGRGLQNNNNKNVNNSILKDTRIGLPMRIKIEKHLIGENEGFADKKCIYTQNMYYE